MTENRPPHSIEYFGVARQYWWNFDFLGLLSRRWELDGARRALDVGCGVGHWTAVLSALLPPEARVIGIDREPEWIRLATAAAAGGGLLSRVRFQLGDAERLPFADSSFDLVSCQTLLIHLADPLTALTEMRRVLAPGGRIVVVEPNNLVQSLIATNLTAEESIEAIVGRVRFHVMCERGRQVLGEGDFSVGDRVPAMLAHLGFEEIHTFQSDKTLPLLPPYAGEEQGALRDALLASSVSAMWPPADAKRYLLAADGATIEEYERLWALVVQQQVGEHAAARDGTFARSGGRILYVISARK